jgi:DNA polymerase-3 subunit chi
VAQVDFYQLTRDPVERVVPLLAAKAVETGGRLLVVCADAVQRATLSQALWERNAAFLANGEAGEQHEARQPVLLADDCKAANGARMVLIADGAWREEAANFDRAILLFGSEQTEEARRLCIALGSEGHALRIFKQRDDGGWREGR